MGIIKKPLTGELVGILANDLDTGRPTLSWYIYFKAVPAIKSEMYDNFSIIVDDLSFDFTNKNTWMNIEEKEFEGDSQGSFYNGQHHQSYYVKIIFLERKESILKIRISMKFELEFASDAMCEGEYEIELETNVKFKSISIRQEMVRDKDQFFDKDHLRQYLAQFISLDGLSGPFYPFPPEDAYSMSSVATFEPVVS